MEEIKTQKFTIILIGINISIFILMFLSNLLIESPNKNVDFYHYILVSFSIYLDAYPFSIITSAFLHGGIIHLSLNMFVLYIYGNIVEEKIKYKDFLILYMGSLIVSSLFAIIYLNIFNDKYMFVVGASGAIFGIWSFYSAMVHKMKEFILFFLGYHLVITILNLPIAWYSHLGGSLFGILFFYIYYNKKRKIGGMTLWN